MKNNQIDNQRRNNQEVKTLQKRFQKKKENFICEICGRKVVGNGYTNHCPHCLWSKHVDDYPGDRRNKCRGMMKPTAVQQENGRWKIIHCCQRCGVVKKTKASAEDDWEIMLKIAQNVDPGKI